MCQRREVAEEHERFVEHVPLGIASPAWPVSGVRAQDVVKRDEMTVAQSFCGLRVVANSQRVCTNLVLWKCDAYLQSGISPDLVICFSYSLATIDDGLEGGCMYRRSLVYVASFHRSAGGGLPRARYPGLVQGSWPRGWCW